MLRKKTPPEFNRGLTVALLVVLLAVSLAGVESAAPAVSVSVQTGSLRSAGITVEASDSQGLDALEVSCPAVDSTYTVQLSRAAVDRQFRRTFTVTELCPEIESRLAAKISALQLEVTVRNTRGVSARAPASVQLSSRE